MTADLSGIRSLYAGIEGAQFDVYPEHPQHIKVFVTDDHRDALAAFIAAAPSTVARLLGIVERVEALHVMEYIEDGEYSRNRCSECLYEAEDREDCPTIQAITGEGGA